MKVVFCCRDNYQSKYIAEKLHNSGFLGFLLVESQAAASKRKIKRLFKHKSLLSLPGILLDIMAFSVYSFVVNKKIKTFVKIEKQIRDFPLGVKKKYVSNINSEESIQTLLEENPDIMVVYGTAILKERVIKIPRQGVLNIHSGIVPYYRNVHSDFWAYLNKDFQRIGITIMHLDKGIDSGDIALKGFVENAENKTLAEIKKDLLILAVSLIVEALHRKEQGTLPRIKQEGEYRMFSTPAFLDIIKLFYN